MIWVRNCETEENVGKCYLGHRDSPLTLQGYMQAANAADILSKQLLGVGMVMSGGADMSLGIGTGTGMGDIRLFTSDLGRCVTTANIIASKLGIKPIMDPRLRELNFGQWEGLTYNEVNSLDQKLLTHWYDDPFNHAPPSGETLLQ